MAERVTAAGRVPDPRRERLRVVREVPRVVPEPRFDEKGSGGPRSVTVTQRLDGPRNDFEADADGREGVRKSQKTEARHGDKLIVSALGRTGTNSV